MGSWDFFFHTTLFFVYNFRMIEGKIFFKNIRAKIFLYPCFFTISHHHF